MDAFQYFFEIPAYQHARYPKLIAGGHWKQSVISDTSMEALQNLQTGIALQLLSKGIQKGDRVILITDHFNIEWLATDMAVMSLGAISVPVHFPLRKEDLQFIFDRIEPALVIKGSGIQLPSFQFSSPTITFEEISRGNITITPADTEKLQKLHEAIQPADMATIVHTSGSSGEPRAVCLSHQNLMSNLLSILSLVPFTPGTRVMSFLPLSHIFERMVCYVYLASGASIYFLDSYRYAVFALKDIRPDYFTSVPLILERFAAALEDRIDEMGWFTRWAYQSWEKSERGVMAQVGSLIAHQWIIKRWKRKMGGKLKGIISGAAYLDPKTEKLYERSGIKIRQGYGLTEASPVISINRFEPYGHRRGTVGIPIPGVEVKIAEDGEVLAKGPNIMMGYYKDEEATNKIIIDGWLHTGDIGRWEKEDFLVITDRKSNIYKHASGKFISPAQIESILTQNAIIRHAVVIGYHRPFNIALIVPDFDELKRVCEHRQIHWTAPEYMVHNTLVLQLYRDALDHPDLQTHERIEQFALLADEWNSENGMLTPTFKPRRKGIEEKYSKTIEELYE